MGIRIRFRRSARKGRLKKRPQGVPHFEIQVHPGDIRRRVRYFFLSRRQVLGTVAGILLFVAFLSFNLLVFPQVLGNLFSKGEYVSLVGERARQGERLQELIGRLSVIADRSEDLHLKMDRIYLAYGLESDASKGQGGFPFQTAPVPDSIYSGVIRQAGALEARINEQLRVLETFVGEVQSFEAAHGDQVRTTPSTSPLRSDSFVLTSPFGNRRSPFTKKTDFHTGVDLAAPVGTPVYAPADGVVVFAGRYPLKQSVAWWRYGKLVALRHGSRFITLFGHCDEIRVRSGRKVKQGDEIATVGNTGWSTSPHLHYEVRHRGEEGGFDPIDPRIYILDHQWRDQEQLLVRARVAPDRRNYEPLPRIIGR
jgi:murein DD-endopeptidase MepM/ murein hydrolase activator NlpD